MTTSGASVSERSSKRNGGAAHRTKRSHPQSVERLVDTATVMFNRFGIHATGIDRILAEAGVARMMLYNHFGSKDGLVREVLLRESRLWFERLDRRLATAPATRREKVAAYFDTLRSWFSEPDFKGCAFINAVGESSIRNDCVTPIAKTHRDANVAYVRGLLGSDDPVSEALAETIVTIANGVTVDVMVTGDLAILDRARDVVLGLVEAAG